MSEEVFRFRAINYKGKREYVFDEKGKYVRKNGKFVIDDNTSSNITKKLSKDAEITNEINAWLKKCPKVKYKVKGIKNLEKKLYYIKCWVLTEENDLTVLPNHDKRGFKSFHLDHIIPISFCYKNNVAPEMVADIRNLRFVHFRTNLKKRDKITERAEKLIKEFLNL